MKWSLVAVGALVLGLASAPSVPKRAAKMRSSRQVRKWASRTPLVVIREGKGFRLQPCPAAGCPGGRVEIPMRARQYDFAALGREAKRLRSRYPKDDRPGAKVRVEGDPPWWVVARTLAVLRRDPAGQVVFPVVLLQLRSHPAGRSNPPDKGGAR